MSIREATLNDVEAISPLFDAYRVFYEQTSDLDGAAQCLKENLSCQRSHVFVFEDNETVLGFTQLYPAFCSVAMQPFFVLYDLYVVPAARAQGWVRHFCASRMIGQKRRALFAWILRRHTLT